MPRTPLFHQDPKMARCSQQQLSWLLAQLLPFQDPQQQNSTMRITMRNKQEQSLF